MLLSADRILFPDADAPVAGFLQTAGDRIVAVGSGTPPGPADEHLSGIVVPGYVDVHCHGGGGASFVTDDPDVARQVLAAHRRLGVTTMVAVSYTHLDVHKRQVWNSSRYFSLAGSEWELTVPSPTLTVPSPIPKIQP